MLVELIIILHELKEVYCVANIMKKRILNEA
jgi:hypothetical protein